MAEGGIFYRSATGESLEEHQDRKSESQLVAARLEEESEKRRLERYRKSPPPMPSYMDDPLVGYDPERARMEAMRPGQEYKGFDSEDRGDLAGYLASLEAERDARGRAAGAGRGVAPLDPRYQAAIDDALEYLGDVTANRAALGDVYEGYGQVVHPYAVDAIDAALDVSEIGDALVEDQRDERVEIIADSYDRADSIVEDVAELIDAGDHATAAALGEITGREMEMRHADAEADELEALIQLEEVALHRQALADMARDEGEMGRLARLDDVEFKLMQDDAEDRLEAAREAARAAAEARRAAIASRNRAIRAARESVPFDAKKAGQYSVVQWMKNYNMRPEDAENLLAKIEWAATRGIPANPRDVRETFADQGLSHQEIVLIAEGLDAYDDGSRGAWVASGGADVDRGTVTRIDDKPTYEPPGEAPPPLKPGGGPS